MHRVIHLEMPGGQETYSCSCGEGLVRYSATTQERWEGLRSTYFEKHGEPAAGGSGKQPAPKLPAPEVITSFSGRHRFLNNFYKVNVTYEGVVYPSVEHAYQAAKTLDPDERQRFLLPGYSAPGNAKRLGRSVTLRPDWEEAKLGIMRELLLQKFRRPELRPLLLGTDSLVLIEGNNWGDEYWGAVRRKGDDDEGESWHGLNHLGQLLMEVRAELRQPPGGNVNNYVQVLRFLEERGAERVMNLGEYDTEAEEVDAIRFEVWVYRAYSFVIAVASTGGCNIYGRVGSKNTTLEADLRYLDCCFRDAHVNKTGLDES